MRRRVAALLGGAVLLMGARSARASYSNGQAAVAAVGQQNLSFSGVNGTQGVGDAGYASPSGVWSDGTVLIVADTGNNRVLIYNSVPASNGTPADVVVGQPDFISRVPNQGGAPAANTLSAPAGVYFDGSSLYIADTGNHRVLIYFGLPNANNTSADLVVGQADFAHGLANQGGAVGAATLSSPGGVYADAGANVLYVSDAGNNRVLIYNPIPASNGDAANVVVGQATMSAASANQGVGTRAYTLSSPAAVRVAGGNLYVADRANNRVLIYNPVPAVNGSSASVVVGQASLTAGAANGGASVSSMTLSSPGGLDTDGTRLFVSDGGNNRLLIFDSIPARNGVGADLVAGQSNFKSGLANRGSAPAANTLSGSGGVLFDGAKVYKVDAGNNRVLIYNPLPTANGPNASVVVGQANMTTGTANLASSVSGANTLFSPGGVWTDRARLFAADRSNNRVLIFDSAPTASGASADVVVGQPSMSSNTANNGGRGANTLSAPAGVFSTGTVLFIADTNNNRVLIYNSLPAANNASASVAVGQTSFLGGASNRGGAPSAQTLSAPTGVFSDGTRLFIADRANNRVLIYNSIPAANGAAANVVVGQSGMATASANAGGLSARSLNNPAGIFSDGTKLFVADQLNNRVLIYNSIPAANGAAADVVVGQPNMASNQPNQGLLAPTNGTMRSPSAVASDGTSLYVVDSANNRILVFTPIPTANGAAAAAVIGQSSFTTSGVNQGGSAGASTLAAPQAVSVDSATGRMYVSDANNNRSLLYLPAAAAPVGAAGTTVNVASPVSPVLVTVQVPPSALPAGVTLSVGILSGPPAAASPAQTERATGIAFQVTLDQTLQPTVPVTLTASYRPADVAGFNAGQFALERYDDVANVWVPLPSTSDTANNRVIAQTNHLSKFQIMQVNPAANDLTTVRVFPNPFQPPAGHAAMTFASLPPGGRVRIYTPSGMLVKDLSADATGIARWDGTNQNGRSAASGVYFAYVEGAGRRRVFTVAIQR